MGLVAAFVLAFALHLAVGDVAYSPKELLIALFGSEYDPVIMNFRLPRATAAVFAGISLGLAGSALQSLFRNPLADPYVSGVSSGAGVGGALAFLLGWGEWFHYLGKVGFAFLGGAVSLGLVVMLSRKRGTLYADRLLISGVMVGALFSALMMVLIFYAGDNERTVMNWLMGSITPMFWDRVLILFVSCLIGGAMLISQSKRLNVLALGTDVAKRSGIHPERLAMTVMAAVTLLVSVTVGIVGVIGFLGLVAPHLARRFVGVDWRQSLIASGLIGGALLSVADVIAQVAIKGVELQVGIVTAVLGAPFLLAMLRKD